jgi:coenzyme F420-reducing hydrogenase beta subunit
MPKEVAAANHRADVSVNALAVGLPDGTLFVMSGGKFGFSIFASRSY